MGIHQIFAQNLRKQCEKFESIADACKQIDVNRQQFNKYLSSAMLPNARTLKRICQVLEIEEWELFVPSSTAVDCPPKPVNPNNSSAPTPQTLAALGPLINVIEKFNVAPGIEAGFYHCYFPLHGIRGFAVRSTLLISKSESGFRFVRHTRIASPSAPKSTLAYGKHRGSVISNGAMDYFIGFNSVAPMNISFLAFPREATEIKVGLAIIHGLNQHFACRVVLESIGLNIQQAKFHLSKHSIISTERTELNPVVAKILNYSMPDVAGQLTMLNIEKFLFSYIESGA